MKKLLNIKVALITGFMLRLIWMLIVDVDPISDSSVYDDFAISLTQGNGFAFSSGDLTAFWPVGTSAVYALLYSIFGHHYIYIAILNLALGMGILFFGWRIAAHYFNDDIAVLTTWILALWPLLIQFTTVLASELLFVFLMLFIIHISLQKHINIILKAILFGSVIGFACHIRPTMAPLLLILPILEVIKDRNFLNFFKMVSIAFISCAIIMTPWSHRNTQLYGERTMLSTNFGPNLWMGNNPRSNGAYMGLPDRNFENEKVRDNELKKEAIEFIVNNPGQYAVLAMKRMGHTFSRETIGIVWNEKSLSAMLSQRSIYHLKLASTFYWYLALIAGILGAIVYFIHHRWITIFFPPLVITAYFISIPLLTVGQDRYHIPMIPFIACFFAYIAHWLMNRSSSP